MLVGAEINALVVGEDQDSFAESVLKAEGWAVTTVDAADTLEFVETQRPDVVVLTLERFGLGIETCAALRARSRVPVIILSRSSAEEDVVAGLRSGADALVVYGVGPREFVARIRALLRRVPSPRRHEPTDTLQVGPVVLNRATRQVHIDSTPVVMPRREFDILEVLMREVDRTVTKDTLRRLLWGMSRDSRTLDVQVRRLRVRLAAAEGQRRIVTVRGVGYRFTTVPEPPAEDPVDVEIDLTVPQPTGSREPTAAPVAPS